MLTLPGPQFLILYVVICVAVYLLVTLVIETAKTGSSAERRIRDPYLIACLRGDMDGSIRVATLALVLRRLLKVDDPEIRTVDGSEIDRADIPLEKALLIACRDGASPAQILRNPQVRAAAAQYQNRLIECGLIPDASVRRRAVVIGIAVIVLIAAAKLVVALSTGHFNVLFLVLIAGLAALLLSAKRNERLTLRGRATLGQLSLLFASLKSRRHVLPASAISEATLLAAVFGVYLPPGMPQGAWEKMFPLPTVHPSAGLGSGSGCGGSGGCGGGGCGGGCGGCGS
jgi:uncharacterized protein (TIGR04222 family)